METTKETLSVSAKITLDTLFKNCPEGIVCKDPEFRYVCANTYYCNFFGQNDSSEIVGLTKNKFLSKANIKLIRDADTVVMHSLKPVSYVMSLAENKLVNVTTTPIIDNDTCVGIITNVKDITLEENIKEDFVNKHFQLKAIMDNLPMIIYMQDKDLNYIAGTKPSMNFVKNHYDECFDVYLANFDDSEETKYVMEKSEILIKKEQEFIDNEGKYHRYKVSKAPIKNFNNDVTGIITLVENRDDQKRIQVQKETFVATVGHDLKNPTLAQIHGLEYLLKGYWGSLNKEQTEILQMILDSCRYMQGMLASMLDTYRYYSGAVRLNFEDFPLPELANECISEMIYVAKNKDIKINIKLKKEQLQHKQLDFIVRADRIQIKRVIMNLLSNAIKYAFNNTNLDITLFGDSENICFQFENKSPYIPEEMRKNLFNQYVSYAGAYKEVGIGLGLYSSNKIIKGHNGELFVNSFEDNRNVFGFRIPIHQPADIQKDIVF